MCENAILDYWVDCAEYEEGCFAGRGGSVVSSGYEVTLFGRLRAGVVVAHGAVLYQPTYICVVTCELTVSFRTMG